MITGRNHIESVTSPWPLMSVCGLVRRRRRNYPHAPTGLLVSNNSCLQWRPFLVSQGIEYWWLENRKCASFSLHTRWKYIISYTAVYGYVNKRENKICAAITYFPKFKLHYPKEHMYKIKPQPILSCALREEERNLKAPPRWVVCPKKA